MRQQVKRLGLSQGCVCVCVCARASTSSPIQTNGKLVPETWRGRSSEKLHLPWPFSISPPEGGTRPISITLPCQRQDLPSDPSEGPLRLL